MPTEAELDELVLSRHRTTLKLAWEAELREDLEDGGDDDAAYLRRLPPRARSRRARRPI